MNKKANIEDVATIVVFLLVFSIAIILCSVIFDGFNTYYQASTAPDTFSKGVISDFNSNYGKSFDYGFGLLLFGVIVFSVVMARMIPSSTAFYVFALIACVFIWLLSIMMSYFYNKFTTTIPTIETMANTMPIISFVMPNLIYYALIYTTVVSIALYTKDN